MTLVAPPGANAALPMIVQKLPLTGSENTRDVSFVDHRHGWAVMTSGKVLATVDGGQTWSVVADVRSLTDALPIDIDFVDRTHGWIAASGPATMLATSDGGLTWTVQKTPITGNASDLLGVRFLNAQDGWAVGGNWFDQYYAILATTDGGQTWTQQYRHNQTPIVLTSVDFIDPSHGWAAGGDGATGDGGAILTTSDGGQHWSVQASPVDNVAAVDFVDASHGWAVGGRFFGGERPLILATSDGGTTWTPQTAPTSHLLTDVDFVDTNEGWAVGHGGTILHTSDGGTSWEQQFSPTVVDLSDVDFLDPITGWIGGGLSDGGTMLVTAPIPTHVSLTLSPSTLEADGASVSTATVIVRDQRYNVMRNESVRISPAGDASIGAVTNRGGGTYTAPITASYTPGTQTITAKVGGVSVQATLTQTPCLTVRSPADSGPCTLRDVIATASALSTPTTIKVLPGLPQINLQSPITFTPAGPITIKGNGVTINGNGSNGVLIDLGNFDLTVNGVTITGSNAGGNGAAIVMNGPWIQQSATLTLSNCTLTGNRASTSQSQDVAGAVLSLTHYIAVVISHCSITDNQATSTTYDVVAGAVDDEDGPLTIKDSTITGNSGTDTLGGDVAGGAEAQGGKVVVTGSSISDNSATSGNGTVSGGIDFENADTATITDSSFTGNRATGGPYNGTPNSISTEAGAFLDGSFTAAITNSTITNNVASGYDAVGGVYDQAGSVSLIYSTLARNTAEKPLTTDAANLSSLGLTSFGSVIALPRGGGPNCIFPSGAVSSTGYNFSDDASCGFTAGNDHQGGGNPVLGPLADNGGPGLSSAPAKGSPLINAIPAARCTLGSDERGIKRPQGVACDIGAIEDNAPVITLQPVSRIVLAGTQVIFRAQASGIPTPSVRWQRSSDRGQSWADISGATSDTLSVTATPSAAGYLYRAVFSNDVATTVTDTARLSLR